MEWRLRVRDETTRISAAAGRRRSARGDCPRWQQPVCSSSADSPAAPVRPDLCQEVFLRVYSPAGDTLLVGRFPPGCTARFNVARDDARRGRHRPEPLADREPVADPSRLNYPVSARLERVVYAGTRRTV
jgi:hypothetical protein